MLRLHVKQGGAVGIRCNGIGAYDNTPCTFRRIINVIKLATGWSVIFQYPEGVENGQVYFNKFIKIGDFWVYIGMKTATVASDLIK